MIRESLKYAISQIFDNKRLVVFYYLTNLLLVVILIIPLRNILGEYVGHSLMGAKLAQSFDMNMFFEIIKERKEALSLWIFWVFVGAALYWTFMFFISGGVLHVLIHEKKGTIASALGNSARYFPRMIRLFLWSLPVLAILFSFQLIYTGIQKLIFGSDPYQSVLYWSVWVKMFIRFLAIWFFAVIFDYARIHLVQTDERKTRKSLIAAIRFVFGNLGKTVGLKALLLIAGIAAFVILQLIFGLLSNPTSIAILISLLVGQIYMIFRAYLKLITFSSQAELYRDAASEQRIKDVDEILLAV